MIKKLFFLSLTLFLSFNAIAQTQIDSLKTIENPIDGGKKLQFGLGFGLNFVGGTSLNLSPNLTYNVNEKISVGAGILVNYNAVKNIQTTTTAGVNALFFYKPIGKLITTAEFAEMYVNRNNKLLNNKENFWDSALFVGAGYQITSKISVGGKYNLLYKKDKSVYSSPFIPFVNISF
ncbi:hypothetical protein [Frigoriflavimonas asaccharolytica]|uniref:Outer membrane protein with beta-barrel domain n=1 Tax=Frigoriflavimonas asaccharolytica TaxID=2735899 RepID=A0A8J8K746_9FLAO|nr:hypothetical protein [Frigoriflavimonas asaccharolytica]NRS91623.1 hypothetical protein [Frigoriflavimonas asaccharolytica]